MVNPFAFCIFRHPLSHYYRGDLKSVARYTPDYFRRLRQNGFNAVWLQVPMRRLVVLAALLLSLDAHAQPRFVPLGDLPGGGFSSGASGVSADGSIVVGQGYSSVDNGSGPEAFRWTAADGMVGLGHLSGGGFRRGIEATAVSANGSAIVGYTGIEAFRWRSAGGMVGLGNLPGGDSFVSAQRTPLRRWVCLA